MKKAKRGLYLKGQVFGDKPYYRDENNRRTCNKHHLTPKSRPKEPYHGDGEENLLYIHIESHEAWHRLFQNMTLEEVIALLQRLALIKGRK